MTTKKWPKLALLILFATMAMGGSFTCFYHDDDDDDDDHHHDGDDHPPASRTAMVDRLGAIEHA